MRLIKVQTTLYASFILLASVLAIGDVEYIIFPIHGLDPSQSSELEHLIRSLATKADKFFISRRYSREKKISIPTYWGAILSEAGFRTLNGHRWVEDIFPNEPLIEQFADYSIQHPAPEELRVISQPPGPDPINRFSSYVYRSDRQRHVFIYHAELGINQGHVDFAARPIEWLYTDRAIATGHAVPNESPLAQKPGHSTCTASKAAGNLYGASRLATLVVVKMPDLSPLSSCELFSTITDHIRENGREGHSIVSVSWGSKRPVTMRAIDRNDHGSYWFRVREQIRELSETTGTLVIFAAGNSALKFDDFGRKRYRVDTAPAILAAGSTIQRLLAVSSVDNEGRPWASSQRLLGWPADRWNLFAPGANVACAAPFSTNQFQIKTGTSFAAPLAAGMIADAMATNQITLEFGLPSMGAILSFARGWKRPGGTSVVWNHVDKAQNPPSRYLQQLWFNHTNDVHATTF